MNNQDTKNKKAADIAQFRFGLIAPVVQGLFPDPSQTAYFKRIAQNPIPLSDGSTISLSYKTLEGWYSKYISKGLDGLMPRERSDKGCTRALSDSAAEEIFRLKNDFPRMNATQIYNDLVKSGFVSAATSVDSVQRFVKNNDLKSARNPNVRDRKAFEEDEFGKMWQADTCYICHITENGISKQVYCVGIIDDHSRMIVGAALFYSDNAYNFQKVLKDAIATYGIPDKLYVDNGGPYSNAQLSMICVSAGIRLLHTRVRDGASKAKIERLWRSIKSTWLYNIKTENIKSLDQFNEMLKNHVRDYNTRKHSGIGCTPIERFTSTNNNIRKPISKEWLDDCFYNRITRKVRKDSTISIDKTSYDVPMQFIGMSVDIRFLPDDMDNAFILYENTKSAIKKTDKIANCHTKRNNPPSLDYSKLTGGKN